MLSNGGYEMKIKAPRGTADILPEESAKWQYAESVLRNIADFYNYHEVRTPVFEHTEVFKRGVGDTTDIVQKEMYEFEDRGGRSITLRPEGTAPVVRAYVENKMYGSPVQPTKWYYFAEMFRYERPQQGRMRQLHQFGVEVLGSADPAVDAEVIALAMSAYDQLGLKDIKLVLNSLGDKESRDAHRQALVDHFTPYIDELCSDCQSRLDKNPLRILDCKTDKDHPAMASAPAVLHYLNEDSEAYFTKVKKFLDGMNIPYEVDPTMVRGLDYYNHTAFEIMSNAEGFGAITTLLGGGRYNGLTEELGGPETPGIGFGMGLERLMMALESEEVDLPASIHLDVFMVTMGDVDETAVPLLKKLRDVGIHADKDYQMRKAKAQFKAADRFNAKYVLILGEEEIEQNKAIIRSMATGEQTEVALDEAVEQLQNQIGGEV